MIRSFWDSAALHFCRLGAAGLAPSAPGTWGTALATVLAPIWFCPLSFMGRSITLTILFVVGGIAASRAEILLHRTDPGEVVIDELVGLWLVLLPFKDPSLTMLLAAFVLFRFFDILKPWPVSASETWLPAGFGIMIDDVVAGALAMACLILLRTLNFL
ncbi:MAG: phosphatidylglycerophosphatase A [Desulfovibrionaceae bacterium]